VCQDAIDNSEVSGIVALVARRCKIVYHKTFGTADATGVVLKRMISL
jgi:hypothetical protein